MGTPMNPLSTRALQAVLLMICTGLCMGCEPGPSIELGWSNDDGSNFVPTEDGETIWVHEAPQTGRWIMPTVRGQDLESPVLEVHANLVMEDGSLAADFRANLPFLTDHDGYRWRVLAIALGTEPGGTELEDIYGNDGTLSLTVIDDDVIVSSEHVLHFRNGDE